MLSRYFLVEYLIKIEIIAVTSILYKEEKKNKIEEDGINLNRTSLMYNQ